MRLQVRFFVTALAVIALGSSLSAKSINAGYRLTYFEGEEVMLVPPTDQGWSSFSFKWVVDFPVLQINGFELMVDCVTTGFEFFGDGTFHYWGTSLIVPTVNVGALPLGHGVWEIWGYPRQDGTWAADLHEMGIITQGTMAGVAFQLEGLTQELPSGPVITSVNGYLSSMFDLKRNSWKLMLED